MPVRQTFTDSGNSAKKGGEPIAVVCPQHTTTDMREDNHDATREDVDVPPTESFALQFNTGLKFLEGRERTNVHITGVSDFARCHNASISSRLVSSMLFP